MVAPSAPEDQYREVLQEYFSTHSEESLYRASLLTQELIQAEIAPDEITDMHFRALQSIVDGEEWGSHDKVRMMADGHQFLLEVMINYGAKYREYMDYKLSESVREAEARLEAERRRAEEAERSEIEKGEVLAAIAHELGTPVTAAKGNVEIAERLLVGGRTADVRPVLGTARSALERLSQLTADLMMATVGELPEIVISPVRLADCVTAVIEWAQTPAAEAGVKLSARMDKAVVVLANEDALVTITGNLISNAIRYTLKGGEVKVAVTLKDNWGCIEVTDTGIGMSAEAQARIFDKFYRAPEARQLAGGGLGIGLSIARHLIERQDGEIDVKSTPGRGTRFEVRFRLAQDALGENGRQGEQQR